MNIVIYLSVKKNTRIADKRRKPAKILNQKLCAGSVGGSVLFELQSGVFSVTYRVPTVAFNLVENLILSFDSDPCCPKIKPSKQKSFSPIFLFSYKYWSIVLGGNLSENLAAVLKNSSTDSKSADCSGEFVLE